MKLTPEQAREINEELARIRKSTEKLYKAYYSAREANNKRIIGIALEDLAIMQAYKDGMQFVIRTLGYTKIAEEE